MQLTLTADEVVLHRTVGTETFLRGRDYALRGAVLDPQWRADREHVFGQVRGTARTPYTALAFVAQSSDGRLASFSGSCTCPVGVNCKHTVALLLAALPRAADAEIPQRNPAPARWERSLLDVVRDAPPAPHEPGVALQFEVLTSPGDRGVRQLGLRPVLPGKNGGWVRSGISWSSLSYLAYGHRGIAAEHLRLLAEIMAMDSTGPSAYYGANQAIHLESLTSRRIWDLFSEAHALGLPMVHAGRQPIPVTVCRAAADLALDASRGSKGVALRAVINAGGERPAPDAMLLLGDPAHGLAWWRADGENEARPATGLRLAPFDAPLDPAVRRLLDQGTLHVPRRDESRFFDQYYPALRQRVRLTSADESIELPEPEPPALTAVVRHLEGHRVTLEWEWQYVLAGATRHEPLWPPPPSAASPTLIRARDLAQESQALAAVTTVTAELPELSEPTPEGRRLSSAVTLAGFAAARFTTDVLPQLAQLDGLTVQTQGTPANYREAEAAPVIAIAGTSDSSDRDWFDLAVTVSVDGEHVPFESLFLALSAGQTHLVLASGTYFGLDRPEFRTLAELIAEARTLQDRGSETMRLSRFQADLWAELDRLGVISGQAADWQRTVRALASIEQLPEPAVPATLQADLRPYQRAGFSWLAFLYANQLGGVLADDMGLGKTIQTLALICHAKQSRGADEPFLVVAPTSVVANWASECAKFAPDLSVVTITETRKRRGRELKAVADGADVVITSYTLFRLEYDDYAALGWAGLILDEAQFVKNHQALGHQCAKRLPTPFKLAITGTPMENNIMELWSLLSITAPGLFANPARFEKHYRVPIEQGKNAERLSQLRRRIRPLMLRRTKEQVAPELPDKQEQVIELPLNPKHQRVYQTHLQRERQKVLGLLGDLEKNRFEIFRSLTLLRQACLDASLIDPSYAHVPSTKLDVLMELLTEITGEGHRTLVFSQFTRFLDATRKRLDAEGIEYCYLDGSTRNRSAVLTKFKNSTVPVFLISLKAGGFGLNLTEADYCVLLDPWWNPATEAQAVDRVHRIGQTKKVMVYRLIAKDTIEQKVMALKAAKAALFGSVLGGGEMASAALTASDIRGMLE